VLWQWLLPEEVGCRRLEGRQRSGGGFRPQAEVKLSSPCAREARRGEAHSHGGEKDAAAFELSGPGEDEVGLGERRLAGAGCSVGRHAGPGGGSGFGRLQLARWRWRGCNAACGLRRGRAGERRSVAGSAPVMGWAKPARGWRNRSDRGGSKWSGAEAWALHAGDAAT
jgi:hypothetical protein